MRWFKHLTDSLLSDGPKVILSKYGAEGIGIYWMIVEDIAHGMKPGDPPTGIINLDLFAQITRSDVGIISGVIKTMCRFSESTCEFLDDKEESCNVQTNLTHLVRITIPKLTSLRDEYSLRKTKTYDCPDSVGIKSGHVGIFTPQRKRERKSTDTEKKKTTRGRAKLSNPQKQAIQNLIAEYRSEVTAQGDYTGRRAETAIAHWLKTYSLEQLRDAKTHYVVVMQDDTQYRYRVANFYSKQNPRFLDYLEPIAKEPVCTPASESKIVAQLTGGYPGDLGVG